MSTIATKCVFCNKDCKLSDSRPYPNNQAKELIHNRCRIKKSISDKNSQKIDNTKLDTTSQHKPSLTNFDFSSDSIVKKDTNIGSGIADKRSKKLIEHLDDSKSTTQCSSNQFFFDLKAGIAKPHEKKQFLHHRKICEIASRYNDDGFQEESVGRAYDHSGKDLNTLGDDDELNEDETHEDIRTTFSRQFKSPRPKRPVEEDDQLRSKKFVKKSSNPIRVDHNNPCWFCLSSPNVEKHLILSIGDYCYLTLAKGGLSEDHFLLIPIEHFQAINDDDNGDEVLQELERYKSSLVEFFRKKSKGVVFFERNFRSVHWQLQVVPVPSALLDGLDSRIRSISSKHFSDFNYIDIPMGCSLRDMIPMKAPYMYWQIEPTGKRFVSQIKVKNSFFPLQVGRITLADETILDCEEKIDWKKCIKSIDEYLRLANKIKEDYSEYDIA